MENTISTGKAAKLLGVSVKTLQRWEREGRLVPVARTDSNRRLYTETQIREFIHKLMTRLCRENQAVVIEDLHVKGMLANDRLARA